MKLTKQMRNKIDAFDEAACYWGWQEDQGIGSTVDNAREAYEESKKELEQAISRLQSENRTLRAKYKSILER